MICTAVQKLIDYALEKNLITSEDVYVVRNELMEALGLNDWSESASPPVSEDIETILAPILDYACQNGIIEDTANNRDLFDTKIMGILTGMPREVIGKFREIYAESPEKATAWYFEYSKDTNYVRAGRIAKDLKWVRDTEYGTLDITINCSKPEKDPRDIAAAKTQKAVSYPKCQLCSENAGFAGTLSHPARQNLRPIPLTVGGEPWQVQYSPYGYYNEHCILFNEKHVPMKIDGAVFGKLFDAVDFFPHYFFGSNADLPIVGGSILTHEHFQGGGYTFAMEKAEVETEFSIDKYPSVKAGIVKWPMSVIRLASDNRKELEACCALVLDEWRKYTDADAYIFAETDGVPHNTITPIARKAGNEYICNLVLRNNITTEDRPMGLYHPNPTLHHIKKENIGLIEVMGLAVLPSRLAKDVGLLEAALCEGRSISEVPELASHGEWFEGIKAKYPNVKKEDARNVIEQEIGEVFNEVLKDAGVFKRNAEGKAAFMRFVDVLKK